MTFLYNIPQKTQAQNNANAIGFGYNAVATCGNELNYKEKVPLTYFDKIKLLKSLAAHKLKGKGQCVIILLNYLIDNADNKTGISYHSQERMSQMTPFSKVQIINSIKTLVEYGFIFKQRRGRRITNMYMINYDLIHDPEMKCTINRFNYKSYPRKPRRISPILEVKSEFTLSTNTDIKEVSINTYEEGNTNFFNFNDKIKEEIPIKMAEDWKPTLQTNKNLKKCLGVTDQFISDEIKGFIKSVMRSINRFYEKELTIHDWNALFYVHCKQTLDKYSNISPSRRIPLYRRLDYNDKPVPTFYTVANTSIQYEDMRKDSSPDDVYETEEELEDDLAAWYAKMGTIPPKI